MILRNLVKLLGVFVCSAAFAFNGITDPIATDDGMSIPKREYNWLWELSHSEKFGLINKPVALKEANIAESINKIEKRAAAFEASTDGNKDMNKALSLSNFGTKLILTRTILNGVEKLRLTNVTHHAVKEEIKNYLSTNTNFFTPRMLAEYFNDSLQIEAIVDGKWKTLTPVEFAKASANHNPHKINEDGSMRFSMEYKIHVLSPAAFDRDLTKYVDSYARSSRFDSMTPEEYRKRYGKNLFTDAIDRLTARNKAAAEIGELENLEKGMFDRVWGLFFVLAIALSAVNMAITAYKFFTGATPPNLARKDILKAMLIPLSFILLRLLVVGICWFFISIYDIVMPNVPINEISETFRELVNIRRLIAKADPTGSMALGSGIISHYFMKLVMMCVLYFTELSITLLLLVTDAALAMSLVFGPILLALCVLPGCERFFWDWIKGLVTLMLRYFLISFFVVLLLVFAILTMADTSTLAILGVTIALVGCVKNVPKFANGLDGQASIGFAVWLSTLPTAAANRLVTAPVRVAKNYFKGGKEEGK